MAAIVSSVALEPNHRVDFRISSDTAPAQPTPAEDATGMVSISAIACGVLASSKSLPRHVDKGLHKDHELCPRKIKIICIYNLFGYKGLKVVLRPRHCCPDRRTRASFDEVQVGGQHPFASSWHASHNECHWHTCETWNFNHAGRWTNHWKWFTDHYMVMFSGRKSVLKLVQQSFLCGIEI